MRAILVAGLFTVGMMGVAAATPHHLNTAQLDTATAGAVTLPGGELGPGPIVVHPVGPTPRPMKLKAASPSTAAEKTKEACTRIGESTAGSM